MANKLMGGAREASREAVLPLFFDNRVISRAQISRESGLSKQTISIVIAELLRSGLVDEIGVQEGGMGRRAVNYQLSKGASFGLGIDLGGTNLRAGLVNFAGQILDEVNLITPHRSIEDLIESIENLIKEFMSKHQFKREKLTHLVMGVPGIVSHATGFVKDAPNVSYLNGKNVKEILSERLKLSVLIENDVNVAALGEFAASSSKDFGFISVGTGIGMGLILDGKLRRGFTGAAGEIGYMPIGAEFVEDREYWQFESLVGGAIGEERYRELSGKNVSLREIFSLAQEGVYAAHEFIENLARDLALGLKAVQALLDLEEIVLGGGIGSRVDLLEKIVEKYIHLSNQPLKIRRSVLGTSAGLSGAISVALQEMRQRAVAYGKLGGAQ